MAPVRSLFFPQREEPKVNTPSALPVDDGLLITATGYEDLRAELERLRGVIAPELSERLRDARQDGHLADNPPLFDLLEEQAQLDQRIAVLEGQLAAAQIAAPTTNGRAGIGSRVRVRDLEVGNIVEYELVGASEPNVGNGRVSVAAPVGSALVGQRVGARLDVATPGGTLPLEVIGVLPANVQPRARKAA
jgi:transcription elongation factor GreA